MTADRDRDRRTRGGPPRMPGGRRVRRKICFFCANRVGYVDFKDIPLLRKYISDRAKILPRRTTGNCARHQRELTRSIKRARHMALVPFVQEE